MTAAKGHGGEGRGCGRAARGKSVTAVKEPAVVRIDAIDGMARVGKSEFAVHVAHVLAPRCPDGQIFLELYAHTGITSPLPHRTR